MKVLIQKDSMRTLSFISIITCLERLISEKQSFSYAETNNFLNFDENSLLELLFLESEIEELKNTLHVSDKLNGNFASFTEHFLLRYDKNILNEICSEIYESPLQAIRKNLPKSVLF